MSKAYEFIKASYYDSAITKARTDLEEALIWAIEKRGQNAPKNGNVVQLYDQFKALYNMHRNKDIDRRIKDLLSGLNKIVSSVSEMRNIASDSHVLGSTRITLAAYQAKLFVDATVIFVVFIHF